MWHFLMSPLKSTDLDAQETMQKKTFTKWINYHLETVKIIFLIIYFFFI